MTGIASYTVVLWLIGGFGTDLKVWMVTKPEEVAVVVISAIIVWFIVTLSSINPFTYYDAGKVGNVSAAAYMPKLEPAQAKAMSERDNRYAAAHESGHALVYASLGSLPPGIEMVIKESNIGS